MDTERKDEGFNIRHLLLLIHRNNKVSQLEEKMGVFTVNTTGKHL